MLMIDRNYDGIFFADGSGGAPLLWQHLSWIFFSGAYMLILIFAFGAIAEIVTAFSGKPLFNRSAVMVSLAAIAVIGTLAWMQNMLTAPIGIGWMYFAMLMSLALIVPVGLVVFNLIATLFGGVLRMRAPLLYAVGALSLISIGLAAEIQQSLVAAAWDIKNTTDATAATHFALVGGAVFGGLAALHYWYPKMTGRTMGESLARISFWTMVVGVLVTFVPLALAGYDEGQVIDTYKFFDGTGVNAYNLIATIGAFVLAAGIVHEPRQRDPEPRQRRRGGARPLGRRHARVVHALAAGPAQLRRPAGRPQRAPDARHPRGDRPPHRQRRAADARVAAGSLTGMQCRCRRADRAQPGGGRRPLAPPHSVVRDYLTLTKPKVQSLLLFTTVTTMYVAGDPSLRLILLTCLGGALSAGGAGAINHAVDRDIDRMMARTADRPVASGRVSPTRRDRLRRPARLPPPSCCWR